MYTLQNDRYVNGRRKSASPLSIRRDFFSFLGASAFCLLFSLIYQVFSHGVHSPYMTFLFLWPMVLGALPALVFLWAGKSIPKAGPAAEGRHLYIEGVAALTMASLLRGVLEIAGTASVYQQYLMIAGWILAGGGAALYAAVVIIRRIRSKNS